MNFLLTEQRFVVEMAEAEKLPLESGTSHCAGKEGSAQRIMITCQRTEELQYAQLVRETSEREVYTVKIKESRE